MRQQMEGMPYEVFLKRLNKSIQYDSYRNTNTFDDTRF